MAKALRKRVLHLDDELAAFILQAAARSHPNECCGLIEGEDAAYGWRAIALHEAANLADDPKRHFLIDPQAQFDLLRKLRGGDRRIIGCYHSHPNGSAEPSATDAAGAYESGFLYLIAAGAPGEGFTLAAHVFDEAEGFSPVELP